MSFLEIEGRRVHVRGGKVDKEERQEELDVNQDPGFEGPPRNRKGQERREQRRCQERSGSQRSGEEE